MITQCNDGAQLVNMITVSGGSAMTDGVNGPPRTVRSWCGQGSLATLLDQAQKPHVVE